MFFSPHFRTCNTVQRNASQKAKEGSSEDSPIRYSTSKAHGWSASHSFQGPNTDKVPWYQPFSVIASVAAFLIYFCVLREENDVDQILGITLYERIPGLEEKTIEQRIKYNRENGLEIKDLEERLKEIRLEKAEKPAVVVEAVKPEAVTS